MTFITGVVLRSAGLLRRLLLRAAEPRLCALLPVLICLNVDVLLQAALKLVQKTREFMQRTGGHALAMFADSKHQCQFFATEALESVATDPEVTQFFGKQLVQNLLPNQFVIPRCIAAPPGKAALSYFLSPETGRSAGVCVPPHCRL